MCFVGRVTLVLSSTNHSHSLFGAVPVPGPVMPGRKSTVSGYKAIEGDPEYDHIHRQDSRNRGRQHFVTGFGLPRVATSP